jgi:hypothetical protein
MCSPRNLIQGPGLDGTVGDELKHGNWIQPKKRWMDAVKEDSYQITELEKLGYEGTGQR